MLVVAGLDNNSIAADMGVQPITVKKHISSCFLKLDVWSRTELVIWYKGYEAEYIEDMYMI